MRRSSRALAVIGLLALTCAGAATANAASGSAVKPSIVCPVVPAGPPCCEPLAGPCPTALTIQASPDPSTARQAVRVTGQLSRVAAGATVTLWQELPGQRAFHAVAHVGSDATGTYAFDLAVQTNRSWYVTADGLTSVTVEQSVKAIVTLSVSGHKSGAGELVTFKGRVTPSHAGERIRVERRGGHGWVEIAAVRLTHGSSFTLHDHFAGTKAVRVRVALAGDSRNIASYSATLPATL